MMINLTKIDIDVTQRNKKLVNFYGFVIRLVLILVFKSAPKLNRTTINELIECSKIISKVKDINSKLQYQKLQGNFKLIVYKEASFGKLTDGSQCAYLIF